MGCLINFRRKSKHVSAVGASAGGVADGHEDDRKDSGTDIRTYGWEEIRRMSSDFEKVIGWGGFATVYLANLSSSSSLLFLPHDRRKQKQRPKNILSRPSFGAVKIQSSSNPIFCQELDILLRIRHTNIVKLLGYSYSDKNQDELGALIFEYVPNGSLQDKLHGNTTDSILFLSWTQRMVIAFQLGQALEYLHQNQIVHGDIKASNVLLDNNFNCKLCDFGSAKMGFTSTVINTPSRPRKRLMLGSPGYTDPLYLTTGIASKKNDVYSYGVILLELLTGKEAFCEQTGQFLTYKILRAIDNNPNTQCETLINKAVTDLVDPRLKKSADFDIKEAESMFRLASACLQQSPALRPSVLDILRSIKDSVPSVSFRL